MGVECVEDILIKTLEGLTARHDRNHPRPGDITLFERTVLTVPPESMAEAQKTIKEGAIYLDRVGMDYEDCTLYKLFKGSTQIDISGDQIASPNDHNSVFKPPIIAEDQIKLQIFNLSSGKTLLMQDIPDTGAVGSIKCKSTANFPEFGVLRINGEILEYNSKDETTFKEVTRATNHSTPAAHQQNNIIYDNDKIKTFNVVFAGWIRGREG